MTALGPLSPTTTTEGLDVLRPGTQLLNCSTPQRLVCDVETTAIIKTLWTLCEERVRKYKAHGT